MKAIKNSSHAIQFTMIGRSPFIFHTQNRSKTRRERKIDSKAIFQCCNLMIMKLFCLKILHCGLPKCRFLRLLYESKQITIIITKSKLLKQRNLTFNTSLRVTQVLLLLCKVLYLLENYITNCTFTVSPLLHASKLIFA